MVELKDFKYMDIVNMDIVEEMFEFHYIDLEQYGHYLETFSVMAKTAFEGDIPIFIAAVTIHKEEESTGEGIFVMSKEYQDNFRKYGLKTIKDVTKEIKGLGLDFLYCSCYNNNVRGQRLVKLLGFKEHKQTKDAWGRQMKQFKLEVSK